MTSPPTDRTLGALLAERARHRPEAIALVAPGRTPLTHGELAAHLEAVKLALRARGIGRRGRVAAALPHGPELLVALAGVAGAATAIPLDPAWRRAECLAALTGARVDALLVGTPGTGAAREAAGDLGIALVELVPAPPDAPAGMFALRHDPTDPAAPDEPAERDHVALVMHTSGTTGLPKRVPLSHANVVAGLANLEATLRLGAADRGLAVMPFFHVHGLMVAWSALAAGGSIACPPPFDPTRVFDWLAELEPTWYSAVPAVHHAILAQARLEPAGPRPARLRLIRSASAPLALALAVELETVFGAPVLEAYGMTEAAHQIAVSPLGAGGRKPGSVGLPTGCEVVIIDHAGHPLPAGETGQITIRGPALTAGYEDDQAATAAAFSDGWFRTGDLGHRDGAGHLFITGRRKDLINRGGEMIAPREVEDVLAGHPAVAESAVFAVPHPVLGEDVAAAVVRRPGARVTEREIREFVARSLSAAKVPATIRLVEALPRGASGKIDRTRLGAEASPRAESRPPGPGIEAAVAAIFASVLDRGTVGADESFFALGGDSLKAMMVVSRIRAAFGVDLSVTAPFEAPTVAELTERIEAARVAPPAVPIPVVSRAAPLPLAFPQLRFWLLQQLNPEATAFNVVLGLRLRGRLNTGALEKSVAALVHRHEVFRTSFTTDADGAPVQSIAPRVEIDVPVRDLQTLPMEAREAEARRLLEKAGGEPFDLTRTPLLRARLLRLGAEDHVLALCTHHIAVDGWSLARLGRDLGELYRAFAAGEIPDLPALSVQYGDFAAWQRTEADSAGTGLAWWRERLGGGLPELLLPTDRDRLTARGARGRRLAITLPPELTARLDRLAQAERASPFMVLLAALSLLLHRYSGQDDVVVGAPLAGRLRPELEELVGCFLNLVVLRTDVGGRPTFRELLRRARETALGAYANQDVPFERVLEARPPSRTPLFRVLLNMHEFDERPALAGLDVERLPLAPSELLFDLTLYFRHEPGGLRLTLAGDEDLFSEPRLVEMLAQLRVVLEQALADPDRSIHGLSLVTDGARAVLPDPTAPLDSAWHGAVHERVTEHARRAPARLAIEGDGERWTYGELEAESNRLAHALRAAGVGAEDVVAIWARRSPPLVRAVLGALKAGGAYVIFDPAYPAARLADAVAQAQPRAWIEIDGAPPLPPQLERHARGVAWRGRLGPGTRATVVAGAVPDDQPATPPTVPVGPDSLASIVFTSGSTGRPHAVLGRHGPLSHFLPWQCEAFTLAAGDRFTMLSGLSHDPLQRDMFTPLWAGATLCVPDTDRRVEPQSLAGWMAASAVTVANLTPAMIQLLAEAGPDAARVDSLRWAFIVGAPLTRRDVARLRALAPAARAVNLYGSTETQRALGYHIVPDDLDALGKEIVPLGRAFPGAQLLVLDAAGLLAGVGELGEIAVRSPHLARGYLGEPALTAERFVGNPFASEAGDRLYRTGDLGRFLPDGSVEFVGRRDAQVKIRGFRVELGEVENALAAHPGVREAVVLARDDGLLAAYVVAAEPAPEIGALRRHLRQRLPDYMLPSRWLILPALPRTPNGKVDHAALPPPDARDLPQTTREPAASPLEHQLASVFRRLLDLPEVGATEDFFELGGHSLLAVRLVHEIERVIGRRLPLATLYRSATIRDLAAALLEREAPALRAPLLAVQPAGERPPFFFLHGDFNGGGFYCLTLARLLGPDQPFYVLHPHGLDGRSVERSIDGMARDHLATLRAFRPQGPYLLGGHCNGALVAFEMARRLSAAGERVDCLVLVEPPAAAARLRPLHRLLTGWSALRGLDDGARAEQFVRVRWFLRGLRDRVTAFHRHRTDNETSRPPLAPPPATTLDEIYRRAIEGYVPLRYGGRVLLLRAAEARGDADRGWRRVTDALTLQTVPGDHMTCLTTHAATLAERLRACLDSAR